MTDRSLFGRFLIAVFTTMLFSTAYSADPWEELPPGEGRKETFIYCSTCHSIKLVAQQGLTRERWEGILAWMEEEQGMVRLEPELEEKILRYLSTVFTPDRPYYRPEQ